MSNYIPIIVNASGNTGTFEELPVASNLDFTDSGIVNLDVGNLQILGGNVGQVLSTDGSGNLSWANGGAGGGNVFTDITVNNSILLNEITLSQTGNLLTAEIIVEPVNTPVPTQTALSLLVNFSSSTQVLNDLDSSVLPTTGSDWTLSTNQTKFGLFSWYNTNSNPNNKFQINTINPGTMNSSSNWTIDMWVYCENGASGAGNQTLVNGSYFGEGPNNIWLGLDNGVPTNGTLKFKPQNNAGSTYTIGTMNGQGWYHVGIMRSNGILYGLFNGTIAPISGNPSYSFPSNTLEFLGGSNQNAFASGYVDNIRISKTFALFVDTDGTYSLPVSTDYDPNGDINIYTPGSTINALPAPTGISNGNTSATIGTSNGNVDFYIDGTLAGNVVQFNSGYLNGGFGFQSHLFGYNTSAMEAASGDLYFTTSGANAQVKFLGNSTNYMNGSTYTNSLYMGTNGANYHFPISGGSENGQVLTYNVGGECVWSTIDVSGNLLVDSVTANDFVKTGNILLQNDGSNVVEAVFSTLEVTTTNLAVTTAIDLLINFTQTGGIVQNDNGNVSLTTVGIGGPVSINNTQTKYGPYSWQCTNPSGGGFGRLVGIDTTGSGIDFSLMNTNDNFTIDWWFYPQGGTATNQVQVIIQGNPTDQNPATFDHSILGLRLSGGTTNAVQYHANTLSSGTKIDYTGNDGDGYVNGQWNHAGLLKLDGVTYVMLNGQLYNVTNKGNPTFVSDIYLLGGADQYNADERVFGSGWITNIRVSTEYALILPIVDHWPIPDSEYLLGTYDLPISTDYDPTGNIDTYTLTPLTGNGWPKFQSSGFYDWQINPSTLTPSQAGVAVQVSGNIALPLATDCVSGASFTFTNDSNSVGNINATGSDYISHTPILTSSNTTIKMFPGETLTIASRGPATTEWNCLGGSALLKYQPLLSIASLTSTQLTSITGVPGQLASVSDSAGGGNPNDMLAFWDTTHSRWSYVHDNSAV